MGFILKTDTTQVRFADLNEDSEIQYELASTLHRDTISLNPNDCYEFIIYDEDCNGIFGPGKFTLLNGAEEVMTSGRAFQCSEIVPFYTETLVSSIVEHQSTEFELFPNPAAHIVRIKPAIKVNRLSIYNLQGQLVLETTSPELDISSFSSGVYFMHILSVDGTQQILKMVKQ